MNGMPRGIRLSRASGDCESEASIAAVVIVVMRVSSPGWPLARWARNLARVPKPGRGGGGKNRPVAAGRQPQVAGGYLSRARSSILRAGVEGGLRSACAWARRPTGACSPRVVGGSSAGWRHWVMPSGSAHRRGGAPPSPLNRGSPWLPRLESSFVVAPAISAPPLDDHVAICVATSRKTPAKLRADQRVVRLRLRGQFPAVDAGLTVAHPARVKSRTPAAPPQTDGAKRRRAFAATAPPPALPPPLSATRIRERA